MDIAKEFIGVWSLVKWTAREADGRESHPFGEDAIGQILYDPNGNMMVELMKRERKLFASGNFLQGTTEEILSAYNGFFAYSGTYTIDTSAKAVTHHIQISHFPNWVGHDQIRYYTFSDGQLRLSTPVIGTTQHEFLWQRKQ
ncbi:lipocalin-like domain-containing protein [Pontibacter ruber]|uniref:Lipocalin-like domain-containing protein n=2 Tax=Pontibacter ruber TaxID=1343895 RepID=A0ABW5CTT7_9BACT